jgi:hypothetical protein
MSYQKYEVRVYPTYTEWRNEQGHLHRIGGPAVENSAGYNYKAWYINGELHRTDGPAIEYNNKKYVEYWLNNEKVDFAEFKRRTEPKPSCEGKTVEIDGQKYKLVLA